jgi:hypothetical protein
MSEMKLIMESWRGYLIEDMVRKPLFEDYEYITGVLGVPLPLDESGTPTPLTEELRQQILHEQMLFEGFWDDAVQKVKQAGTAIGARFLDAVEGIKKFGEEGWRIIQQLYRVATNPDLNDKFAGTIWRYTKKKVSDVKKVLQQLAQKLGEWGMPTFGDMASKALEQFNKIIESLGSLSGWKKAVGYAGFALAFRWLWDKVADFIEPYKEWMEKIQTGGAAVMDEFKSWLQDTVKEKLTSFIETHFKGIVDKLVSVATGIKPWWDAAVKIVGGVGFVIDVLRAPMGRFGRRPVAMRQTPGGTSQLEEFLLRGLS